MERTCSFLCEEPDHNPRGLERRLVSSDVTTLRKLLTSRQARRLTLCGAPIPKPRRFRKRPSSKHRFTVLTRFAVEFLSRPLFGVRRGHRTSARLPEPTNPAGMPDYQEEGMTKVKGAHRPTITWIAASRSLTASNGKEAIVSLGPIPGAGSTRSLIGFCWSTCRVFPHMRIGILRPPSESGPNWKAMSCGSHARQVASPILWSFPISRGSGYTTRTRRPGQIRNCFRMEDTISYLNDAAARKQ